MHSKRVLKMIICLIVSVSIIIQCSFSSFAAKTMFSVDSSEWIVADKGVQKGVYPDKNPSLAQDFIPKVYSYSDLFGDSYVISKNWADGEDITQCDILLPEIPSESFFPSDYSSLIFCYKDSYFLLTGFDDSKAHFVENYDNEEYQLYSVSGNQTAYLYTLSYPFTTWIYHSSFTVKQGNLNSSVIPYTYELKWSDTPVYDYTDPEYSVWSSPSDFNIFDEVFTHNFSKSLSYTSGLLYFHIPEDVFNKLLGSDIAFLLEDFGYIIGTESEFVYFTYNATFYVNGTAFGTADFMDYTYRGWVTDDTHLPGYAYINDYYDPIDLTSFESFDTGVDILFSFQFASDGYNLIFPGSFSIVDYSDLKQEVQHNEVIDKIDSVGGSITTSIGNAVTDISSSINSSTSQITGSVSDASDKISGSVDAVNDNIEYIISGDIEIEQPDMDTSELDDIVAEQDEIIGDILSSIDVSVANAVPEGYKNYGDYLIDNISSFKSSEYDSTFTFIRSTFDNLISSLSILPLVLFSLSFGFAVFALGRRLS